MVASSVVVRGNGNSTESLRGDLKRAGIESVARHVEDVVNDFILRVNALKNETFPQSRKDNAKVFAIDRMKLLIDKKMDEASLFSERSDNAMTRSSREEVLKKLRTIVKGKIDDHFKGKGELADKKNEMIIGSDLDEIVNLIMDEFKAQAVKVPKNKKTKVFFKDFLTSITPLKKYHEGSAIEKIEKLIKLDGSMNKDNFVEIGRYSAQLFDYPKVNKVEQDDATVLYEAIPRHMIIIFAAFKDLRSLDPKDKETIYDAFLDQILDLQLWKGHEVENDKSEKVLLNREILKRMVLKYSNIDASLNFSMKPSVQYPKTLDSKKLDLSSFASSVAPSDSSSNQKRKLPDVGSSMASSAEPPEKKNKTAKPSTIFQLKQAPSKKGSKEKRKVSSIAPKKKDSDQDRGSPSVDSVKEPKLFDISGKGKSGSR